MVFEHRDEYPSQWKATPRTDAGEVLTTTTVRDLVAGSGIRFDDRGEHELKGLPGPVRVLSASGESLAGSSEAS